MSNSCFKEYAIENIINSALNPTTENGVAVQLTHQQATSIFNRCMELRDENNEAQKQKQREIELCWKMWGNGDA